MWRSAVGTFAVSGTGVPVSPVIVTVAAGAAAGSVKAVAVAAVMAAKVFLIELTPEIRLLRRIVRSGP
jgi:hypothetical protein